MDPVTGTLISGGLKLLGGLFGGGKKSPTPRNNLLSQAQGARQASEQYGFNPLTMLQYGQTAGAMGAGGAPPLASSDLILGALQDVSDVATGEAARRAEANKLELELGRRKLDAMSGLLAVSPSAAATVGDGLPTIGRRAAMAVTPGTQVRSANARFPVSSVDGAGGSGTLGPDLSFGLGAQPLLEIDALDPRRSLENKKVSSEAGWSLIDNPLTGRFRIPTFGDEPIDLMQLPVIAGSYIADRAIAAGAAAAEFPQFSSADAKRMREYKEKGQEYLASRKATPPFRKRSSQTLKYPQFGASRYQ